MIKTHFRECLVDPLPKSSELECVEVCQSASKCVEVRRSASKSVSSRKNTVLVTFEQNGWNPNNSREKEIEKLISV